MKFAVIKGKFGLAVLFIEVFGAYPITWTVVFWIQFPSSVVISIPWRSWRGWSIRFLCPMSTISVEFSIVTLSAVVLFETNRSLSYISVVWFPHVCILGIGSVVCVMLSVDVITVSLGRLVVVTASLGEVIVIVAGSWVRWVSFEVGVSDVPMDTERLSEDVVAYGTSACSSMQAAINKERLFVFNSKWFRRILAE